MRNRFLKTVVFLALLPLAGAASTPKADALPVHGDYLEVRTASVFCGACHYNGERVTDGRSAVLAWHIAGGSFSGVDLAGVSVMAAVGCADNLAEAAAPRQTELVIAARPEQVDASIQWIKSRAGAELGTILSVRTSAVEFSRTSDSLAARSAGFAELAVHPLANAECCSQPHLVWYRPLMAIDHRRVGYTESAQYTAGRASDAWQRSDENSAFYGTFDR